MNLPSSVMIFALIAFGGFLVVAGNTLYPLAREQEKRARLADDAQTILKPELEANKQLATDMLGALEKGMVDIRKFDVSAWEAVSKGGLLLGLNPDKIGKFLLVYKLCYQANDKNAQLNDPMTGTRSALTNSKELAEFFGKSLKMTLAQLHQAMLEIDEVK